MTTNNNRQAVWTLVQTVVTAILLAIQTIFFGGCVSAGGDVNQTNDVKITVPAFSNALELLKDSSDALTITFDEFETLDNQIVDLRSAIARKFYSDE